VTLPSFNAAYAIFADSTGSQKIKIRYLNIVFVIGVAG